MYEFLQYRVKDAMTAEPVTVPPNARLRRLEPLFEAYDYNGFPVVDEAGRLAGLITKLDFLKAFTFTPGSIVPHYQAIMEQTVDSLMTREPVTVAPELPLSRLLQKMVELRARSFPVLDGDRLVGIIAREDVLKALRHATSFEAPNEESQP